MTRETVVAAMTIGGRQPWFIGKEWISDGYFMVRRDRSLSRIAKRRRDELVQSANSFEAVPRTPVTETQRDRMEKTEPFSNKKNPCRIYEGGDVGSCIQEPMAALLDGYVVARLGSTPESMVAGFDSAGRLIVIVAPVRL